MHYITCHNLVSALLVRWFVGADSLRRCPPPPWMTPTLLFMGYVFFLSSFSFVLSVLGWVAILWAWVPRGGWWEGFLGSLCSCYLSNLCSFEFVLFVWLAEPLSRFLSPSFVLQLRLILWDTQITSQLYIQQALA